MSVGGGGKRGGEFLSLYLSTPQGRFKVRNKFHVVLSKTIMFSVIINLNLAPSKVMSFPVTNNFHTPLRQKTRVGFKH